jgi:hypothetical protein
VAPAPPPQSQPPQEKRRLRVTVGLAFVRVLRPALYALLVASALVSFFAERTAWIPTWVAGLAPLFFAAFLGIFVVYRLALVKARRYPLAQALFQIGLGVLLLVLLLPGTRRDLLQAQPEDEVAALLSSSDPRVRALAAEVAGARPGGQRWARLLVLRLSDDADPRVRAAARASLSRLAGADPATGLADGDAAARWAEELKARGW